MSSDLTPRRKLALGLAILVAAALSFRLAVVGSYRASAGDGIQYFRLALELRQHGRLAYGPAPAELTYTRLPGYPLFLAAVAYAKTPASLQRHLWFATVWNALLDVGTALLVLAILRERRLGWTAAVCGFLSVIVCPLLLYLSMYGLGESLATFLATLQLWLLLRFGDDPRLRWPLLAGLAAGLFQLVRVDAVAMLPVAVLAIGSAPFSRKVRIQAALAYGLAAALLFAPWPLRNTLRFGSPHPAATTWVAQSGKPLPVGMMQWFMSWSSGAPGEAYIMLPVSWDYLLDVNRSGILLSAMYDDEPERQRVLDLFAGYNHERFSPEVDAGFRALAVERARRAPLRTFVTLPLRRLVALWTPIPEYELPVRSRLLHLPALRPWFARFGQGLVLLAALGGLALFFQRGPGRRLVALVVVLLATRSLLICAAHPFPVQRYLAEGFPALLLLSGYALSLPLQMSAVRGRVRSLVQLLRSNHPDSQIK